MPESRLKRKAKAGRLKNETKENHIIKAPKTSVIAAVTPMSIFIYSTSKAKMCALESPQVLFTITRTFFVFTGVKKCLTRRL